MSQDNSNAIPNTDNNSKDGNEFYEIVPLKERIVIYITKSACVAFVINVFLTGFFGIGIIEMIPRKYSILSFCVVFFVSLIYQIFLSDGEIILTQKGIEREKEQKKKLEIEEEKNKIQMLYQMKIGQTYVWSSFHVTRVPNGWMFEKQYYNNGDRGKMVFVPETKNLEDLVMEKFVNHNINVD